MNFLYETTEASIRLAILRKIDEPVRNAYFIRETYEFYVVLPRSDEFSSQD
jgi:hypothetical protein